MNNKWQFHNEDAKIQQRQGEKKGQRDKHKIRQKLKKKNDRQRLMLAGRPNPIAGHRTLPTHKWLTIKKRNNIWQCGKTKKKEKQINW